MKMDWEMLRKAADYYVANGGKLSSRVSDFLQMRIGAYYDKVCEKAGEERVMPLLRSYLRGGIDGKGDRKRIESIFSFLVDLTEKPWSTMTFKGDDDLKKYLLEGASIDMARKYDPKGFMESIDAAIARVALNREMISPLVDDPNDEDHSKAVELTAKYDALISRLEKMKDACPESHLAIIAAVKEVVKLVVAERENIEARYFAPSLSNAPGNVFLDIESHLQMAESIVSRPVRGGKIPSDDDISDAMIQPESGANVRRLKKKVYVKTYRDQCRDLANGIQSDLDKKGRAVEQLGAQYQEATSALEQINAKILDLGRRVQNGMITRIAAEAEGRRIASERARWTAVCEARKRNYTINSAIYDKFVQVWAQHGESLKMVYDNETEDERLIEYFDQVIEVLKRYRGFVNGVAGEGDKNFDFDKLEELLKKVGGDLEAILANITIITTAPIDPTQQIDVSTDTATQGGFNLEAFLGSADPTMGGIIPDSLGGTTTPTDGLTITPDPLPTTDIPTTIDPVEENNPFAEFTRRHE